MAAELLYFGELSRLLVDRQATAQTRVRWGSLCVPKAQSAAASQLANYHLSCKNCQVN